MYAQLHVQTGIYQFGHDHRVRPNLSCDLVSNANLNMCCSVTREERLKIIDHCNSGCSERHIQGFPDRSGMVSKI